MPLMCFIHHAEVNALLASLYSSLQHTVYGGTAVRVFKPPDTNVEGLLKTASECPGYLHQLWHPRTFRKSVNPVLLLTQESLSRRNDYFWPLIAHEDEVPTS